MKSVLSLEFLRAQQLGLGLDFKSRRPHPIFHDFFMRTMPAVQKRSVCKVPSTPSLQAPP